jgi:hypothetical protein
MSGWLEALVNACGSDLDVKGGVHGRVAVLEIW